jgi:hypothetical protein
MIDSKVKEIREFCKLNSDPKIINKYSKYFKVGYDGYGIDKDVIEKQIEIWKTNWKNEMTPDNYLALGDELQRG